MDFVSSFLFPIFSNLISLLISNLLFSLYFLAFVQRVSFWLAILQQKEYRIDRIFTYLKTAQGLKDFFNLFEVWDNLMGRIPLKRPKITLRILANTVLFIISYFYSLFFFAVGIYWLSVYFQDFNIQWFAAIVNTPVVYLIILFEIGIFFLFPLFLIPIAVFLSNLPISFMSTLITYFYLFKASRKLKKHNPIVIGITGSFGKTSTKLLLAQVLSSQYSVFHTPKSYNTRYSVAKSILDGYNGQQIAILEYGAYTTGEIKFLAKWFIPNIAVITGITPQHLALFGSVEKIIEAKRELPKALADKGMIFANLADENVAKLVAPLKFETIDTSKEVLSDVKLDESGSLCFVCDEKKVQTQLVGRHYLSNLKIVVSLAKYFEISSYNIANSLHSFVPDEKFIQARRKEKNILIIDDGGTCNPEGFKQALVLVQELKQENSFQHCFLLTSGIVDLGDQSSRIHKDLSLKSKELFDKILYAGQSGKAEFSEVFGANCLDEEKSIKEQLTKLPDDTLLFIEGRIRKDYLILL